MAGVTRILYAPSPEYQELINLSGLLCCQVGFQYNQTKMMPITRSNTKSSSSPMWHSFSLCFRLHTDPSAGRWDPWLCVDEIRLFLADHRIKSLGLWPDRSDGSAETTSNDVRVRNDVRARRFVWSRPWEKPLRSALFGSKGRF